MERARRHQRALARAALIFLALCAELLGRSLSHRLDFGRHVGAPSYSGADYYPILLVVVKVGVALMLARLAWRFVKAARLLQSTGARCRPKVRIELSPKLWLGSFLATSLIYLLQMDAEGISAGRWPLLAPWLHTYALPVFALLAVLVALAWRLAGFLHEIEAFADRTLERVRRVLGRVQPVRQQQRARAVDDTWPRRRFGLSFESRPPPLNA